MIKNNNLTKLKSLLAEAKNELIYHYDIKDLDLLQDDEFENVILDHIAPEFEKINKQNKRYEEIIKLYESDD